jgi:hypothetical protein
MASLDGLRSIDADIIDSYLIRFTEKLNNITPTVFNYLYGVTSNIQTQLNSIINTINDLFTSTTGFTFTDSNSVGFTVCNPTFEYLDLHPNANSTITVPQLFINSGGNGVGFYSYNFENYPTITLNQLNFEIYCDGGSGSNDYVRSYIKFYSEDILVTNLNCSNIIQTNILQRNLNESSEGSCDLFRNATVDDAIIMGSLVSTTLMKGQAFNIDSDITNFNFAVNFHSFTDFANTATFSEIAVDTITVNSQSTFDSTSYFNAPIIGSAAGFTALGADSITIDGANGLNTKKLYLTNTLGTSNEYSEIKITSINLIFDVKNGGSGNATNIYFKTVDASNMVSDTLILENNKITLNKPTTFNGIMSPYYGMTFSSTTPASNAITNLYKLYFDNNYGHEKIILYNNGSANLNYTIGVLADTLYYNTPNYHAFYVNGIGNTPVLSLTSSGANFSGLIYGPSLQLKGVGSNVFQLGSLLTPNSLSIDYQGNLNTIGKLTSSGGLWVNGSSGMYMNTNKATDQQNLRISNTDALPSSTGVRNIQIGCNQGQITTGTNNVTLGTTAGPYITTGSGNTCIGYNAMYGDGGLSSGGGGVSGNTMVGAGANITAIKDYSTCLGWNAKCNDSNSVSIGYNAVATLANQIMLGTTAETVYCPNKLVVGSNITLPSAVTSWTFPGHIGSVTSIALTPSKNLTVNGTQYNIIQYTVPQAGVYIIQAQACCIFGTNVNTSLFNFSISTTTATIDPFCHTSVALPPITGHQQFSQLSKTLQVTNTTTIYYMVCSSSNNTTIPYLNDNLTYMTFTRIA